MRSPLLKSFLLVIVLLSSLTITQEASAHFWMQITAEPRYLPPSSTTASTSTITLIVKNSSGSYPVSGAAVEFYLSYPNSGNLNPTSTTTNSLGIATTIYTAPTTPKFVIITAKVWDAGNNTWDFVSIAIYVVGVDVTAYKPQTTPFNWATYQIPEADEEISGAGIRINGDDDNNNSIADQNETSVPGENDLIKVTLKADPQPTPLGLEYVLKRSNTNIKVWESQAKGTAILDATNEGVLVFDQTNTKDVWVENPIGGNSFLEIQARTIADKTKITFDKVSFYSFTSTVIALGGEGQIPTDPPDANHGTFQLAKDLYLQGYDVHMYDEDNVGFDGSGIVYNEVVSAVQQRNVSQIAIFGYSHGGGSTYNLAERLTLNGIGIIKYAAYIDAVEDEFLGDMFQEQRRPPGTAYLVNYYQVGVIDPFSPDYDWGLDGGPILPPGADYEVNVDLPTPTETHYTIDDEPTVLNGIKSRLTPGVTK